MTNDRISNIVLLVDKAIGLSEALVEEGQELKGAAIEALFPRGLQRELQRDKDIELVPANW